MIHKDLCPDQDVPDAATKQPGAQPSHGLQALCEPETMIPTPSMLAILLLLECVKNIPTLENWLLQYYLEHVSTFPSLSQSGYSSGVVSPKETPHSHSVCNVKSSNHS